MNSKTRSEAVGFQTPSSNTGSKFQSCVDTATLTINKVPFSRLLESMDSLEVACSDKFAKSEHGVMSGRWYDNVWRSLFGCQVYCSAPSDDGLVFARLHLPGQFLHRAGQSQWFSTWRELIGEGWKFTRSDLALDDYEKLLTPEFVHSRCRDGSLVSVRNYDYITSSDGGSTLYVGSRSSDQRIRLYDKNIQSKGEQDCLRWEVQLRDDRANVVMNELLNIGEYTKSKYARKIASLVVGSVQFREVSSNENVTRRSVCAWWDTFLEVLEVEPVRVPVPRVKPTLERKLTWVSRQVETTLAVISRVMNPGQFQNYIIERVNSGVKRMNDVHRNIVDMHQRNIDNIEFTLACIRSESVTEF